MSSLNNSLRYNKGLKKKREEEEQQEEEEINNNNTNNNQQPPPQPPSSSSKSSKKRKRNRNGAIPKANKMLVDRPKERFADLGGISRILQDVRELIEYPIQHPEIYSHLGVEPPRGILLHGPPGCGKTMMANAIAGEINVPFLKLAHLK